MPPIDPIIPNSPPPTGPTSSEALRNDSRGSGGGAGGRRKAPEPEPEPEEDEEADAKLDGDSFARQRGGNNLDVLFADKLPWELEEDEKRKKLAEMRQKRLQPPARGRGVPGPTLPGSYHPGPAERDPTPPARPLSGSKGRQVDGSFDATAAVNTTLSAWQTVKDRQTQLEELSREANPAPPAARPGTAPLAGPLLGRVAPAQQPPSPEPREAPQPLQLPQVSIEQAPPGTLTPRPPQGAPRVRAPGPEVPEPFDIDLDELPGSPLPRVTGQTGRLPARPDAGRSPAPPARELPPRDAAARTPVGREPQAREPQPREMPRREVPARDAKTPEPRVREVQAREPQSQPHAPQAREPQREAPRGPAGRPAGPGARASTPPANVPPPSWAVQSAPEEPPAPAEPTATPAFLDDRSGQPSVKPTGTRAAFTYRAVDAATGRPLVGARMEIEPTTDDMLPVLNGVADGLGWWAEGSVPPGEYRVSVRSPGYVPAFQVRALSAGVVDELTLPMAKP